MAAAGFPADAVCLSAGRLGGNGLGALVALASVTLLALTLFTSVLDARMQTARRAWRARCAGQRRLQAANDELRQRAFVDALTGLPNRLLFEDRLAHALARSTRSRRAHAAAHDAAGGAVRRPRRLQARQRLASATPPATRCCARWPQRLRTAARDSDTVARVGGDEFVLLMEDVADAADCVALARRAASRRCGRPFELRQRTLQISCSVGIVVYPDHGQREQAGRARRRRDVRRQARRRRGFARVRVAHGRRRARAARACSTTCAMRSSAASCCCTTSPRSTRGTARSAASRRCCAGTHPERGMVQPGHLHPDRRALRPDRPLGDWVIDEACRQMRGMGGRTALRMRVAINLSVHQLREDDLVAARRRGAARATTLDAAPAAVRDHRVGGDGRPRGHAAHLRRAGRASASTSRSTTSAPAIRAWPTCASCRRGSSRSTAASCATWRPATTPAPWSTP